MKNSIKMLFASVLILSLGSCEKLLDVEIDTTLQESIAIHVDQTNGTAKDFSGSAVINLDVDDLKDYEDLIKDVKIKSFTFELINFSGDQNGSIEGNLYVDGVLLYEDAFIVKSTVDAGTIFTIEDTDQINTIAKSLKDGNDVNIIYSGEALSDNDTMDFDVEITVDVKVTANPL